MTTETTIPALGAGGGGTASVSETSGAGGIATAPAPVGATPPEPQRVTIVETKKPTMDEELSALYDKINPPEKTEQPAPENKVAAALTGDTDEPELPLGDKNTDQPKTEAKEPDTKSSPAIPVPQSWSADVKAKWSSLPPDVQSYIASREKDAHSKITQQGNELREYQPFREINGWIRSQGVPPGREAEVVANWARAQAALDANPIEGLKWLANSYKVDLSKLAGTPQQTNAEGQAIDDLFRDPRLDRVAPMVDELRNQVSMLTRQLQSREHANRAAEQRSVESIIQTFSQRDDVKEIWPDLEDDIVHEIEVLKSRDPSLSYEKLLETATDRAKYANPHVRARILEAEERKRTEANEAQRRKEAAEVAKKQEQAKKAQSMNVRTGATASTPTMDGKWDSKAKLGALYDRITSGSR